MDESLTSMQWLNGMKSRLQCVGSKAKEIRRSHKKAKTRQVAHKLNKSLTHYMYSEFKTGFPVQMIKPYSESNRPPYSYVHLIEMAINSTPDRRMMLKDIYAWIEDRFPFYKTYANKGWRVSPDFVVYCVHNVGFSSMSRSPILY